MEPFGLFQFLQTLLNAQPSAQNEPTENSPPAQTENPPQKEQATAPKNEELPPQNAAALFLENHERRAGRRK